MPPLFSLFLPVPQQPLPLIEMSRPFSAQQVPHGINIDAQVDTQMMSAGHRLPPPATPIMPLRQPLFAGLVISRTTASASF